MNPGVPARWFGITAADAPMVAHRLPDHAGDPRLWPARPNDRGQIRSVCGRERRRSWQPLEDFVRPEAFERCPECAVQSA